MKRSYVAPTLEVELYQLDQAIASNCAIVVSNGPAMGDYAPCEDFIDPFSVVPGGMNVMSLPHNVQFYEDTNCDCYTTGGDYGYWQS